MAKDEEKDFLDFDLDDPLDHADDDVIETQDEDIIKPNIQVMGDGVLLYDNKKYAVGLRWLIADDEGDTDLATQRAKGFKADFYCMRNDVVTQHGFGFLSLGHRISMTALASVAADVLVGEWHGVFVADNGWWYVAVHADNLSPDGDLFFGSEEEAYNHFVGEAEKYRWPRSYAPDSWNLPESSGEIPLNKIIGEASPPALKPVTMDAIFSGKRNKNIALGAGAIILVLLVISVVGQKLLPAMVPMQAQVPSPVVQVSDILQAPPKEPVLIEGAKEADNLTNMKLVKPSAFFAQCIDGFSKISVPLPGWSLKTLKCKSTFVEGAWNRVTGSFEMVEPYLSRFPEGVTPQFIDNGNLTAIRRLVGKKETSESGNLYGRNHAIIALNKRFSNLGQMEIRDVKPAAGQQLIQGIELMQQAGFSTLTQNRPTVVPITRDDLPYLSILIRTKTPPNMIARYFDLPGLIVLEVSNQVPDGEWQYDAKLITQPDRRLIEANQKAKELQLQ